MAQEKSQVLEMFCEKMVSWLQTQTSSKIFDEKFTKIVIENSPKEILRLGLVLSNEKRRYLLERTREYDHFFVRQSCTCILSNALMKITKKCSRDIKTVLVR